MTSPCTHMKPTYDATARGLLAHGNLRVPSTSKSGSIRPKANATISTSGATILNAVDWCAVELNL